jgi:preprotein translocase subunit SecE
MFALMERVSRFVREVTNEAKKVTWPTSRQTLAFTAVVIATVAVVALFIAGVDALLNWALTVIVGPA